jgi:hypothetical protein
MFILSINPPEFYDEIKEEFIQPESCRLQLEHSLMSVSKWESIWKKAFLSKTDKTFEESVDYVRCMTLNEDVDYDIYKYLSYDDLRIISKYIEAPMTATIFNRNNEKGTINREVITSEIIYYWMITLNIPFECQTWHLNRLLTLINVINIKQNPPKKMGNKELMSRNAQLNAERKRQMNTTG